MKKNLLSALIFFVFHSASLAQSDWQWLNPKPSGSDIIDMTFLSDKEGFILSKNHFIKTSNAGESWENHYQVSGAVDMDFKGKTGLIVEPNAVHLTIDKGKTWNRLDIPPLIYAKIIAANILSDSDIAFCTNEWIYSSKDNGKSWRGIPIPLNIKISKIYFFNDTIGFVLTTEGRIYKTVNRGQNWKLTEMVGYVSSGFRKVYFLNDKVGFASRENNSIIKTIDGGETWSTIQNQSGAINSFSFVDENYGFLAGGDGLIYNTIDGGKTLNRKLLPSTGIKNLSLNSTYFLNKDVGFVAGDGGKIFKTTDAGKTWKPYSFYLNEINHVTFPSSRIGYFISAGKLYKTQDEGTTWSQKYDFKTDVSQIRYFSNEKGVINIKELIYKTEDGGTTWKTISPFNGITGTLNTSAVHFTTENTWFASATFNGSTHYLRVTKDGGLTWNSLTTNTGNFTKLYFFDTNNGIGIRNGDLYQTYNSGRQWVLKFQIAGSYTDINGVTDSVAYVSSDYSTLQRTTNKGRTWKSLVTPSDEMKSMFFINDNVGFSAVSAGLFYHTIDGGLSWNYVYQPVNYGANSVYANSENIYCAGPNGMLIKSKVTIADYGVRTPLSAEYIGSVEARVSGTVFTNSLPISNIKLEYGYSEESRVIVAASEPTLASNGNKKLTFNIKNLNPGTRYWYYISFDYKGTRQNSSIAYLTTLPDAELLFSGPSSYGSKTAKFTTRVISNLKSVTDITFEFGKDSLFKEQIKGKPDSVQMLQTKDVQAEVSNLTPGTYYRVRVRAKSNNRTLYSQPIGFNTLPLYSISMREPLIANGIVTINGRIQVPDDNIKNIVVEYDTSYLFKNPQIVIVPGITSPTGLNTQVITANITNTSPEKLYYSRLKVTIGDEIVYAPLQLFSLTEKIEIIPTDVEFYDSKTTIPKALVYAGKQIVTGFKLLFGENGILTDSINAGQGIPHVYSYSTITLLGVLKNLKLNTYYTAQFKGTSNNKVILSKPFTFYNGTLLSNEPEKESNMLVYPNPANGIVKIVTPDKIIKKEIFKTDGALLKTIADDADTIDITDLPTGLYILRVSTPRSVVSYKVIKQ